MQKGRLKSTDRLFVIKSFANFISFLGMLLGPVALFQLRSDIVYDFLICAWFNENRLVAWVFQEMIKRFIS